MWPTKFIQIDKKYIEEKILSCYSYLSRNKYRLQKIKHNLESLKDKKTLDQNIKGLIDFVIAACDNQNEFHEREVHVYLELAFYHHLNQDLPDIIKSILRKGANNYLQFLKTFKPKDRFIEVLAWKHSFRMDDPQIIQYKEYERDKRYYKVTYREKEGLSYTSWLAAVFCCFGCYDLKLVDEIFSQYQWPPNTEFANKPYLIQGLYCKDKIEAKKQLAIYQKSYAADFPPERREIVQGIAENDPSIFMAGIKKINARYTTMWKMSRYEKKGYNDLQQIINDLVCYRWVLSEWAVIGLHLAKINSLNIEYNNIPDTFIPKYLYT